MSMSSLSSVLAGLVLLATAVPQGRAASPAASLPPLPVAAAAWDRLRASGTIDQVNAAHEALGLLYVEGEISDACVDQWSKVDAALAQVPVGIALWYSAAECARKAGDAARAAHYDEGVSRLAAHALGRDSMAPGSAPIAVLNADDIGTIVRVAGLEERYRYVDWERYGRYYPVVLALWDAEEKVERHLAFDFLDVLSAVRSDEPRQAYPVYRGQLREQLIKAQAEDGAVVARDILAVRAADGKTGEAAAALLRESAAAGGLASLGGWLRACDGKASGCGEGAVDALLPHAEAEFALYRVQLAVAQARGTGTPRDLKAALVLLDSAESRLPGRSVAYFVSVWHAVAPKDPPPREVLQRLARAADAGSRIAQAEKLRLALRARADDDDKLDASGLSLARELAEAGSGDARYVLYKHYEAAGDPATSLTWIRRAAEGGDADGMLFLGYELLEGEKAAIDRKAGVDWMRRAAHAGSEGAMDWMGDWAFTAGRWSEAEAWYESAIMHGEDDSLLSLANLLSVPREGFEVEAGRAQKLFGLLEEHFPTPKVRRAHANYLARRTPPDPVRARSLLEQDAKAGDAGSQYDLGVHLLRGRLGKPDADAGLAWIGKAMAQDKDYGDGLAHNLYYRVRTPEARAKALAIERELLAGGSQGAANNLAWWLCVSPDPGVRAPEAGLLAAAKLVPLEKLDFGALDTVAACHAANGDFDRAVQLQAQVVAILDAMPVEPKLDRELRARLDGYRRQQPYVERPEDEDAE